MPEPITAFAAARRPPVPAGCANWPDTDRVSRRAIIGLAVALISTGSIAAALVLALDGGAGQQNPTRADYLVRVRSICRHYGQQLDRIPPPADIATPGEIVTSVSQALPVIEAQESAVRKLRSPDELEKSLHTFFVLTDRSIAGLKEALRGARARDIGAMGRGELHFFLARDKAKLIARRIGFSC